jgi:tRNA-dihydrouridine synthase
MLDETGCAGVSIGRGAFYDPWIFKRTLHYLGRAGSPQPAAHPDAGDGAHGVTRPTLSDAELPPEPNFAERVRVMNQHLDLMIAVFGEQHGCRMFRKIAPWYARRFGPCHEFNKRAVQISTRAEFHEVLENYISWRQQFLDEHGELLPRFRPPPMVASFMREPASALRKQIPVPKGPVEVW